MGVSRHDGALAQPATPSAGDQYRPCDEAPDRRSTVTAIDDARAYPESWAHHDAAAAKSATAAAERPAAATTGPEPATTTTTAATTPGIGLVGWHRHERHCSERENVFRPFYRLDKARSSSTGNSGLGLAIARDIAISHGGNVLLGESSMGGLRAVIRVPL